MLDQLATPNRIVAGAILLGTAVALLPAATAAEPVATDRFDGSYAGSGQLIEQRSDAAQCRSLSDVSMTITEGQARGEAAGLGAEINGLITTDGYFDGEPASADRTHDLDGLLKDGLMTLGLNMPAGECHYVIKLRPRTSG